MRQECVGTLVQYEKTVRREGPTSRAVRRCSAHKSRAPLTQGLADDARRIIQRILIPNFVD